MDKQGGKDNTTGFRYPVQVRAPGTLYTTFVSRQRTGGQTQKDTLGRLQGGINLINPNLERAALTGTGMHRLKRSFQETAVETTGLVCAGRGAPQARTGEAKTIKCACTYISGQLHGLAAHVVVLQGVVLFRPAGGSDKVQDAVVAAVAEGALVQAVGSHLWSRTRTAAGKSIHGAPRKRETRVTLKHTLVDSRTVVCITGEAHDEPGRKRVQPSRTIEKVLPGKPIPQAACTPIRPSALGRRAISTAARTFEQTARTRPRASSAGCSTPPPPQRNKTRGTHTQTTCMCMCICSA